MAYSGIYHIGGNTPIYICEKLAHFLSVNVLFNRHHQNIYSPNSSASFKQRVAEVPTLSFTCCIFCFNNQNNCLLLRFALVLFKDAHSMVTQIY